MLSRIVLSPLEIWQYGRVAVAAAASQHHALSSVVRIPPLPSRLTHARASFYLLLRVSFSLPLVPIRMLSVYGLSASLAPEPRLSLLTLALPFTCTPLPSLRDYLPSAFVIFFYFPRSPFLCPPTSDEEREKKRMEDPRARLSRRFSLLRVKCSPLIL